MSEQQVDCNPIGTFLKGIVDDIKAEEEKQKQKTLLTPEQAKMYVGMLLSTASYKPTTQQLDTLYGLGSKTEINKLFFSWQTSGEATAQLESSDEQLKADVSALNDLLLKQMFTVRKEEIKKHRASSEDMMKRHLSLMVDAQRYLAMSIELHNKADALEEKSKTATEILLPGWNNSFWKIQQVSVQEARVKFVSNPVTLSYVNKVQNVSITVPMGSYTLLWWIPQGKLVVQPDKDCLAVDSHAHPHIGSGGSPCWGNAQNTISAALRDKDLNTILNLTQSFLHSYNPNSPYIRLDRFAKQYEEKMKQQHKAKAPAQVVFNKESEAEDFYYVRYLIIKIKSSDFERLYPRPQILATLWEDIGQCDYLKQVKLYQRYNAAGLVTGPNAFYKTGNNRFFPFPEQLLQEITKDADEQTIPF